MWELHSLSKYLLKKETDLENGLMVARGKGIVKEFGVGMYTLLYLKWITNKDLLYSTGKSAQCHVVACRGGGFGENGYMCMSGWVSSLFTWNYHNIVNCLFSSVQSLSRVRLFATPWIAALQTSLSITNSQSPPKSMSIESVMPSNHLILCRPLLLLPNVVTCSPRHFLVHGQDGVAWEGWEAGRGQRGVTSSWFILPGWGVIPKDVQS